MWKRKILKKKARLSMRQNYWRMIAVCFIITMLTTAYPTTTTFLSAQTSSLSPGPQSSISFTPNETNSEVLRETISNIAQAVGASTSSEELTAAGMNILVDLYTTSTSAFFALLRTVNTFLTEHWELSVLFLFAGVIVSFLYQLFVNNVLVIGEKRFFLEAHNYHQTRISKIFFLYKLHFVAGPAWIMFCRSLFQLLWNFTIIGGIIKYYEYRMIPFILAENPSIGRKDAFFLSRQLMQHNKWKLFQLHFSFIGWRILSLFTFGLLDFVYVNPYLTSCEAELYLTLRRNYVLSRSARYEELNDSYLEHVPSEDELLILKALYDDSQGPYTRISYFVPEQYPVFLFSIQPPEYSVKSPVDPERKYSFLSCLFLFYVFSFLGWIVKALLGLLRNGALPVNSLFSLPWMPLFGLSAVCILLLSHRTSRNPVRAFLLNFVLYSVSEYAMSSLIDHAFGIQLVDYSGYLLNLNGRVYIGSSVMFALIGCAFLYYLAPKWADRFQRLTKSRQILLCSYFSILLIADTILTLYRLLY